jgi:hypothetical protein
VTVGGPAVSLLTYIWHYLVARMLYEHLLRPLVNGDVPGVLVLGCVAAVAFLAGRRTQGRRRT